MDDTPTLKDAVDSWAGEVDNGDKTISLVGEHGEYDNQQLTEHTTTVDGRTYYFHASGELSKSQLNAVKDFIHSYRPNPKECFANSVELALFDERFEYIEGVTANDESGTVHDHAWNKVDDIILDVTRSSSERYGVTIPNHIVREFSEVMISKNRWDILENPTLKTTLSLPY